MMMGWGFAGLGVLLMLGFWLAVVGLAVWLLSRLFPGTRRQPPAQRMGHDNGASLSALDLLKQRYARGEITTAEYDEIRRELEA